MDASSSGTRSPTTWAGSTRSRRAWAATVLTTDRTALPLSATEVKVGDEIVVHLKGIGWTETDNIVAILYDNAYIGYACGFNSDGDVIIKISATGAPGWHYIDLYPTFYRNKDYSKAMELPFLYRHAMLSWQDHPQPYANGQWRLPVWPSEVTVGSKKARRNQQRHRRERKSHRRQGRAIWFVLGALAVLSVAAFLAAEPLRSRPAASDPGGRAPQVYVSMAGFEPRMLTASAGQEFKMQFVNPDSQFHTDGGGWHQFRIDGTGIDVRIPPSSQPTVTLPALAAGTYEFYCDICCGGRANPAMRGVLEVKA